MRKRRREPPVLPVELLRNYETDEWSEKLRIYLTLVETLKSRYAQERLMQKIPVTVAPGKTISLSPGGQNILIEKIMNDFCASFTPGGKVYKPRFFHEDGDYHNQFPINT